MVLPLSESHKKRLQELAGINEGKFSKALAGIALGGAMTLGSPNVSIAQDGVVTLQTVQDSLNQMKSIQSLTDNKLQSLYQKGWKPGKKYTTGGEGAWKRFSNTMADPKDMGNNIFTAPDHLNSFETPWGFYSPDITPTGVQEILNGENKTFIPIYN